MSPQRKPQTADETAKEALDRAVAGKTPTRRALDFLLADNEPPTPAPTPVDTPATTPVITGVTAPVEPKLSLQSLDSTHTTSEGVVYSNMYRLTISKGIHERHFGPKELLDLTGIRSDRTIRTALDGLIAKLSIKVVWERNGYPLGPRYRVFEPREIMRRRREAGIEIDPQTKRIVTPVATPVDEGGNNYPGTPAIITPVTPVDFAGDTLNQVNPIGRADNSAAGSSSNPAPVDDELTPLRDLERELKTAPGDWRPVLQLVADELRRASSNTNSVSKPVSFAVAHLTRLFAPKSRPERPVAPKEPQPRPSEEITPPDEQTREEFERNQVELHSKT